MNIFDNYSPSVLVIDDDPTIHLWAKRHLAKAGFKVISALNGTDGVKVFEELLPDIVLVDIEMSGQDGFVTCAKLRELPACENTPLLMVTGSEDSQKIEAAYLSGATDYVIKPVNWQVLIQRLRYMVKANHVLQRLEETRSRLYTTQKMARLGHWEWNAATDIFHWSAEIYEIFRVRQDAFAHDRAGYTEHVHTKDRLYFEEGFEKVLQDGTALTLEYRANTGDGKACFISHRIEAVKNALGQITALNGTIQDITARKDQEDAIRHLAYYDALTRLPNRTFFLELMGNALLLAKRQQRNLALLFVDLDNFKGINDSYGHQTGDQLLIEVARRLKEGLRESDIATRYIDYPSTQTGIARLGGDEFTVLLTELAQPENAAVVAEKINKLIAEPIQVNGNHQVFTAASIGIAFFPRDGTCAETLLKNADTAMHHAKKSGKGNYQFFHESMSSEAAKRQQMENCMHLAVANNELRLFYQPIIESASGCLIGMEAFMRWDSPELGFLQPGEFIPLAEENGRIVKFTDWALREVCRQHSEWRQCGMGHLSISINLSARQFHQPNLVPLVKAVLEEYAIERDILAFELTESILLEHSDKLLDTMRDLKSLGIKLSIDDFGTGYSSLSYLKIFPLDSLKIDRSFVRDLVSGDSNERAIVDAIMALAHSLNLNTVAEGVENEAQRDYLKSVTCSALQGYFYGKPMSSENFRRYFETQTNSVKDALS